MSDDDPEDAEEEVATGSFDPENKRLTIDFSAAVDDESDDDEDAEPDRTTGSGPAS